MSFRILRNYLKNKKYCFLKNQSNIFFTVYPFFPNTRFFWIKAYFLKKNFNFSLNGKIFYMFQKPNLPFFLYFNKLTLFDYFRLNSNFSFFLFFFFNFFFRFFTILTSAIRL